MIFKRSAGFSLVEVLIASGVFTLFVTGLFLLFRSGQNASAQAFWVQRISGSLRNTTRHISQTVQRSSYPSTIVFPNNIFENNGNDFRLHFTPRGTIFATQSLSVPEPGALGTQFLRFVESFPEKQGFNVNNAASLTYHIYSLSSQGKIYYHRYDESPESSLPPSYHQLSTITRPTIPPAGATLRQAQELISDVESVSVFVPTTTATAPSVVVEITCKYPRGETRRSERAVVVPNVQAMVHPAGDPGW